MDAAGVGLLEGAEERVVVARQRALQEGLAREGDEPDVAGPLAADEVGDGDLGPREARGAHVGDQHGLRDIEREDHVLGGAFLLRHFHAPARSSETGDEERAGEREGDVLRAAAGRGIAGGEAVEQAGGREASEPAATTSLRPAQRNEEEKAAEDGDGQEPRLLEV